MHVTESFKNTEHWVPTQPPEAELVVNKTYGWFLRTSSLENTGLDGVSVTQSCTFFFEAFLLLYKFSFLQERQQAQQ